MRIVNNPQLNTRLPGGQSQSVAIACPLIQQPKMIFPDEPVARPDPQAGEEVMQTFAELTRAHGLTLMLVSHYLEHAMNHIDRVLGVRGGHSQQTV
jgi:energy-coupling factor transport system ATP-binding protein